MYQLKEYSSSITMEQGLKLSATICENVKTDYEHWNEEPDGTYNIVIDLSESDNSKFKNGVVIKLPSGSKITCHDTDKGEGGCLLFEGANRNNFYVEFDA